MPMTAPCSSAPSRSGSPRPPKLSDPRHQEALEHCFRASSRSGRGSRATNLRAASGPGASSALARTQAAVGRCGVHAGDHGLTPRSATQRVRSQMSIAPPVPARAAVQTITFLMGKMDCAVCSGQIVDALKKTPGVNAVQTERAFPRPRSPAGSRGLCGCPRHTRFQTSHVAPKRELMPWSVLAGCPLRPSPSS